MYRITKMGLRRETDGEGPSPAPVARKGLDFSTIKLEKSLGAAGRDGGKKPKPILELVVAWPKAEIVCKVLVSWP